MIQDPIFIIGTERSGSNLLRLMLNAHSTITVPHPPHVMRDMAPFAHLYGDLAEDGNFSRLAADMAHIVNRHFAPWPFQVEAEMITGRAPDRSLYGAYVGLYETWSSHAGKPRWGCKSTFMYRHVGEILAHHESPRLIHLVRDPRDVASSAEKSVFSNYHPFKEAQLWREQQDAVERWGPLRESGKLLTVRYEDLVREPESCLREIMEFVGESFEAGQLDFYRGPEARGLSSLMQSWRGVSQPAHAQSVGRFRRELSPREIGWIEAETAPLMDIYGYDLVHTESRLPDGIEWVKIELSERWRKLKIESRAFFRDQNFKRRWARHLFVRFVHARLWWQTGGGSWIKN